MQGFELTLRDLFRDNRIFIPPNNSEITILEISDSDDSDYEDIISISLSYLFWESNGLENRIPSKEDIVKVINSTQAMKVIEIKETKSKTPSSHYNDNSVSINFAIEILYTHLQNSNTKAVNSSIDCLYALQDFAELFDKKYMPRYRKACINRDNISGETLERWDDDKISETERDAAWEKQDENLYIILAMITIELSDDINIVEECFESNGHKLPSNIDAIFDVFEEFKDPETGKAYMDDTKEVNITQSLGDRLIDHFDFMMGLFEEDIDKFALSAEKQYKKLGLIW